MLSHRTLWLRLKSAAEGITHTLDSTTILVEDIEAEVPEFAELRLVSDLSLSANQLSYIPVSFLQKLAHLSRLDLSDNRLNDLPDSLTLLERLEHLILDFNQFTHMPHVICGLTNLKSLKARKNRMKEIDSRIGDLTCLENLDLSSNALVDLPPSFAELNNLRELSLADNKFAKIPICLTDGMTRLEVFDFSENPRSDLKNPPKSKNLKEFYARRNTMCPSFPNWLLSSAFCKLEIVCLDETSFYTFDLPEDTWRTRIKEFSMRQSKLSVTVAEKILVGMANLEKLLIGNETIKQGNVFWSLPIRTAKQSLNLKEIDMRFSGLPMLPPTIGDFINLSKMDLIGNTLTWLPDEICLLKNLECLLVSNNSLVLLPDSIGKLTSLKELKANHNNLCDVPDSLKTLDSLLFLDFYYNEFLSIPETVLRLTNLLGLDIECNYFVTDALSIYRGIPYESMRARLRDHWKPDYGRLDGPRPEPKYGIERRMSFSSSSSSDRHSCIPDYNTSCMLSNEAGSLNDALLDERWDLPEDSADEFDPTECKVPQARSCSPLEFYQPRQRVFCPASFHVTGTVTRVMQMLKNGTLMWPSDFVQGQFEDA